MAIYDSEGNPEYADGTMFDVTEHKLAEFALAEAKKLQMRPIRQKVTSWQT